MITHLRKLFCQILIADVAGEMLMTPLTANARRHHHVRQRRRTVRVVRRHGHRCWFYIAGTRWHPAFVFNWRDIQHFRNYGGAFQAREAAYWLPVRVVSQVKVGNQTFKKIVCPASHRLNGWVYSGSLTTSAHRGNYYHFNPLVNGILRSEINFNANRFMGQLKKQTFKDLNRDRSRYRVPALTEDPQLDDLATIRAEQLPQRFSHYDANGTPETTDDATSAGLPNGFMASENIASVGMGNTRLRGDPVHYDNQSGYQMANTDNDGMMNHDALEDNGHRQNILDPNSTLVGIGTAYNPKNQIFYLAEDFGNHNPNSSEDVDQ